MTALSSCALVYHLVDMLRHPEVPHGISTIIVLVAFFGSLNLLAVAVLGEYLIKIVEEVKRRPKFIRKAIRHGDEHLVTAAEIDGFLRTRSREAVVAGHALRVTSSNHEGEQRSHHGDDLGGRSGLFSQHYARSGAKVVSVNRRRVPELESDYPSVRFECVDVRSAEEVEAARAQPSRVRGTARSLHFERRNQPCRQRRLVSTRCVQGRSSTRISTAS